MWSFFEKRFHELLKIILEWPSLAPWQIAGLIFGTALLILNAALTFRSKYWGDQLLTEALKLLRKELRKFLRGSRVLTEYNVVPIARRIQSVLQSPVITSAMIKAELRRISIENEKDWQEGVQFTVYSPKSVSPERWYQLLVFAHLADYTSELREQVRQSEQVEVQAREILRSADYTSQTTDSGTEVPATGTILIVPNISGITFEPPSTSFQWLKEVHREEFRFRTSPGLANITAQGHLAIFYGPILIATLPLNIRVGRPESETTLTPSMQQVKVRPYRRIFVSYSHKDAKVVEQVKAFVETLGDRYLQDTQNLRAGEVWSERLQEMIKKADTFQLLWSTNSMRSPFVRKEWEFALSLKRPFFIRPAYWELPFPCDPANDIPPEELKKLHFHLIPLQKFSRLDYDVTSPMLKPKGWARNTKEQLENVEQSLGKVEERLASISATNPMYGYVLYIIGFGVICLYGQLWMTSGQFNGSVNGTALFWGALILQGLLALLIVSASRFWKTRYSVFIEGGLSAPAQQPPRKWNLLVRLAQITNLKWHAVWAPLWETLVFVVLPSLVIPFLLVAGTVLIIKLSGADAASLQSLIRTEAIVILLTQVFISSVLFSRYHQYNYFAVKKLGHQLDWAERDIVVAKLQGKNATGRIEEYRSLCRELWILTGIDAYREVAQTGRLPFLKNR